MQVSAAVSKWGGLVATVLPILAMSASAYFKLNPSPEVLEQFVTKGGFPANTLMPIGILEVVCTLLYAFPRTAVLGAILLTGYLGGATVVHVRGGDAFIAPILIGCIVWLGIYLREPRLHSLTPWRD